MVSPLAQLQSRGIDEFARRWKVVELALFGSVARGEDGPGSDVDVLVTFSETAEWSLWDFVRMRDELRELFGREVDLVEQAALRNPFRREAILRDKKVIYAA